MALFGLFKKEKSGTNAPKGFEELTVVKIDKLTDEAVQITFDVPESLQNQFNFIPGQYLTLDLTVNGQVARRSYSICSKPGEPLAIGVKAVKNGLISNYLTQNIRVGETVFVAHPTGNFKLNSTSKHIVAFAAGSGITPILSMAKAIEGTEQNMRLFYGNRTKQASLFLSELDQLTATSTTHFLSGEHVEGTHTGRLDKAQVTAAIKADLSLLKADAFYICGPEEMLLDVKSALTFFGVNEEKIHFELFTTPTSQSSEASTPLLFTGESHVKMILDDEVVAFNLKASGKSLLDAGIDAGIDAPYSCRGGVCSSCKAKVISGEAIMTLNYSLSDEEVKSGYILTCQAHPASSDLTVSFDA